MADVALKFLGNIEDWLLFLVLVRLIWFCEMAKLNKSFFSNFKRMT